MEVIFIRSLGRRASGLVADKGAVLFSFVYFGYDVSMYGVSSFNEFSIIETWLTWLMLLFFVFHLFPLWLGGV